MCTQTEEDEQEEDDDDEEDEPSTKQVTQLIVTCNARFVKEECAKVKTVN